MTATVEWSDDPSSLNVSNAPGRIIVSVSPPDGVVFHVPLAGGTYAAVAVDCHEFDLILDVAHEKLVEAVADEVAPLPDPVPVPEPVAPPPPSPAPGGASGEHATVMLQPAPAAAAQGSVPAAVLEESDTRDLAMEGSLDPVPKEEEHPESHKSKGRAKHK